MSHVNTVVINIAIVQLVAAFAHSRPIGIAYEPDSDELKLRFELRESYTVIFWKTNGSMQQIVAWPRIARAFALNPFIFTV